MAIIFKDSRIAGTGKPGESAYELAKRYGYIGTEEEFAKHLINAANSRMPSISVADEGKFLQVANGNLVLTKVEFGSNADANGYCWIISNGIVSVYGQSGALLNQYDATDAWKCPADGEYYIELHAAGGYGGEKT